MRPIYKILIIIFIIVLFISGFLLEINRNQLDSIFVSIIFLAITFLIIYGYKNAKKSYEDEEEYFEQKQSSVIFDDFGMAFIKPIFDVTYYIEWKNVKEVVFRIDENYSEYIFYLFDNAKITKHENPWFMNRLFPVKDYNKKEICVESECKNFNQISIMKAKYLTHLTL